MLVKSQLHIHSAQDILDTFIDYSPFEVIDFAHVLGFKILSLTNHRKSNFTEELKNYALKKGIVLLKGVEIEIRKKHVLVFNADESVENIKTFSALREYKNNNNIFVIAPHPFYGTHFCLGTSLVKNIDLFDAAEYSMYHTKRFIRKPNIKAENFAEKNSLPLMGTGDVHNLHYFDQTYSLIDVDIDFENLEKSKYEYYVQNIFDNIKKNNIQLVSKPLSFYRFMRMNMFLIKGNIKKYLKKFTIRY